MSEEYTTENQETALTIFEPSTFMDIAIKPVTDEQAQILLEEINPDDLDILPTGEVYLTQAKYRAKLNKTFKPGGWAMRPISRPYIKDDIAMQEWALYANGQFMAYTVGGAEYKESNQRMNWSDVLETVKSNALMRLCKDLGIASECWNRRFTDHFKTEYCIKVWVDGKNKPQWRRLDSEPFYKETGVANDSPNGYPIEQRQAHRSTEQPKAQTIKPAPEMPQKQPEATKSNANTPQGLTDAVNAALGQKYYNAPSHVYNALGKNPWPKPDDISSWADVYAAALDHARQRLAEKAKELIVEEDGSIDPKNGMPFGAK